MQLDSRAYGFCFFVFDVIQLVCKFLRLLLRRVRVAGQVDNTRRILRWRICSASEAGASSSDVSHTLQGGKKEKAKSFF